MRDNFIGGAWGEEVGGDEGAERNSFLLHSFFGYPATHMGKTPGELSVFFMRGSRSHSGEPGQEAIEGPTNKEASEAGKVRSRLWLVGLKLISSLGPRGISARQGFRVGSGVESETIKGKLRAQADARQGKGTVA